MERFKRTIKKVAALAGGALMVGSAMAGALAALDNLPQPFVSSAGQFDSYIVVGTLGWNPNAAYNADAVTGLARDVASGIDIGAAFAQKSTSAGAGGSTTTSVSSGVLIDAAGDPLNIGEDLYHVDAKLTDKDLDMLADGTFKDTKGTNKANTDYNQELAFITGTGNLTFEKNTKADDKASGDYLLFLDSSNMWAYNYTLDFDDPVAIADAADINQNKMKVLGKTYTMSEAAVSTNLTAINLLSGAVTATQGEYTTQTYTLNGETYEVEVLIIADGSSSTASTVKFRINGETTDAIASAGTYTLSDGTVIGVEELLPNEGSEAAGADQVSFYLGANKVLLKPADSDIKVNDVNVKDSKANFNYGATPGYLDKIHVAWKPDDKTYLAPGESMEDPVFGAFKFVFAGLSSPKTEEIKITPDGSDKILLETMNKEGDALSFDVFYQSSGTMYLGESADNKLYIGNGNATAAGSTSIEDLEGVRFLYDFNDIAHIVEITGIDSALNKTSFAVDGVDIAGQKAYSATAQAATFDFMDADFQLKFNNTAKTITFTEITDNTNGWSMVTTKYGAEITFGKGGMTGTTWESINVEEKDDAKTSDVTLVADLKVNCSYDSSNTRINIATPTGTGVSLVEKSTDDKDNSWDRTDYGTLIEAYTKDQGDVLITYPDEEVTGMAYVSPMSATTSTTETSGSVNVNYINAATGISRTDADFATAVPSTNVILLGGPTVNELVSDLAASNSNVWSSADWADKVDTAVIQLVENAYGNYDALIIAGYDAKDTALAGKVVASRLLNGQFADELTGTMVELSTAGASTVNEVSFA